MGCRWAGISTGVCSHSVIVCHALSPILVSKSVSDSRQIPPANLLLCQLNKLGLLDISRDSRSVRCTQFPQAATQSGLDGRYSDADLFCPVIRFHDLRHTAATLMLLGGVPVKVVSERLGHASPDITLRLYAHVLPGMQKDAAAVMDRLLG